MNLAELSPGDTATITHIQAEKALRRRLYELGLTRGARVEMLRPAPLGDPVEYRVRGYHLALRKSEACQILVEA